MDALYSFDVFDTIITRKVATPEGVFAFMQAELLNNQQYQPISDYIRRNFYDLRIQGEAIARKTYCRDGVEDLTLNEIYEELQMTGELSQDEADVLIRLELETERAQIVPIEVRIAEIKKLIAEGKKVILISDMYLTESQIRGILVQFDEVFQTIEMYVSADYQVAKWSGRLYQFILDKYDLKPESWVHCGDNKFSDIQMAEQLGIRTRWIQAEGLMPIEQAVLSDKKRNAAYQLLIGRARMTRLFCQISESGNYGMTLGSVFLYPYVEWILTDCRAKGIERLYFIARDGYVVKEMADVIIREKKLPIQTHYIYSSRKAWRIAERISGTAEYDIKGYLERSYPQRIETVAQLAEVLELSEEELLGFVPLIKCCADKKLDFAMLMYLAKQLQKNRAFTNLFQKKQNAKKAKVLNYIKQEVDFSNDKFAFVEISGSGYTQHCLQQIIEPVYNNAITTYFFRLEVINKYKNCCNYGFLLSDIYLFDMIEMLTRAPHNQTIDYIECNGKIEPVFIDNGEAEAIVQTGFSDYVEGLRAVTRQFLKNDTWSLYPYLRFADITELMFEYINYISRNPDSELMNFIADMPNSQSGREQKVVPYAPRLSKAQLRQIFFLREWNEHTDVYYEGSKLDYSLLRTSEKERKYIEFYKKHYNRRLGKTARCLKRKKLRLQGKYREYMQYEDFFGEKIILYAAGKCGQYMYEKLRKMKNRKIVAWVDSNADSISMKRVKIEKPEMILDYQNSNYDSVVICVVNYDVACEIKKALIELGVPQEKIVWYRIEAI